jgi:hypothetical protein
MNQTESIHIVSAAKLDEMNTITDSYDRVWKKSGKRVGRQTVFTYEMVVIDW